MANLTASRVSSDKVRKIRIFQQDAYYSIDTQLREVSAYRLDRSEGTPSIRKVEVPIEPCDPLTSELADFVRCVRTREQPKVTGRDGLRALEIARRILDQMTT